MATRRNLAIVPALKVDASTWFGPAGWARITGAHASLPRSTAFAGSTPGSPAMSRADAVAGKFYVVSVSARFVAPSTGRLNIDWYTGGNVYLSTAQGPDFSQAAGTTNRFAALGQAPEDVVRLTGVLSGVDGETQITALMVEEFDTLEDAEAALVYSVLASSYFDGDSDGASWEGDDGESVSTIEQDVPAGGVSTLPAPQAGGLGVRTSLGNTGLAELLPPFAATGLFATATYDDRRGRIRLDVQGLAPNVVRVETFYRTRGKSRWLPVRGGKVAVADGTTVRRIDHYEWEAGRGVEYRIDAISTPENVAPASIVQSAFADLDATIEAVWLKFIPAPYRNIRVELLADRWSIGREARNTVHEIDGRPEPIVVSDVHSSRALTVRFATHTVEDYARLDQALAKGLPAFLQIPASIPLPSMYVSIGSYTAERTGRRREADSHIFTVQVREVAAPPLSIIGSGITWGVVLEQYGTWGELLDAHDTWGEVLL
jgi:hypothetical protein